MDWRERLREPATFRGVPFWVESAEFAGGRRTVRHEYPLRDEPYAEDMGRRARSFPVEGYVIGEEYIAARDALIDALEQEGPGELVHPYHGTRRVICTAVRVRESKDEGGIARFGIDFEETPAQAPFPSSAPAAPAQVAARASVARESVGQDFLARYKPGVLTASAADVLRAATLSLNNARSTISMGVDEAASLRRRLDRLTASAASLVNTPDDLLAELVDLFDEVASVAALLATYGFAPGLQPPATTSTRQQERDNFDALVRLIRTLAIVRAAELAPDETYDSYDTAVAQRDAIGDKLDEQTETADDDAYASIGQLHADLVRAVPGEESDLPRLLRYTPPTTAPSLVLAHRLYGDLAREEDLVTRNHVLRPGFVLGGRELEVVSS